MKILHCCLAAFYIDDFGYQENILPREHLRAGHCVEILASTESYSGKTQRSFVSAGSYLNSDGIPVTRVPYSPWIPTAFASKLRIYRGISEVLERFCPDLIFLHDCQFLSIYSIARFAKKTSCRVVVDCHTDFINSARSWVSREILHKILYRRCAQVILPYTETFFGTLPLRCKFLEDVYTVPQSKIDLLPFGVDDSTLDDSSKSSVRVRFRNQYSIPSDSILVSTGGKIDFRKNIHLALKAYKRFKSSHPDSKVSLLVFGKPDSNMESEISNLLRCDGVFHVAWLPPKEIVAAFQASDFVLFPGTHSVLWEESVGCGVPGIFKKWDGITHLNHSGNCVFLEDVSFDSLCSVFESIHTGRISRELMSAAAMSDDRRKFFYSNIAFDSVVDRSGLERE